MVMKRLKYLSQGSIVLETNRKETTRTAKKKVGDMVVKGLEIIRVEEWRNIIQDREKWHKVMIAAKTSIEYL